MLSQSNLISTEPTENTVAPQIAVKYFRACGLPQFYNFRVLITKKRQFCFCFFANLQGRVSPPALTQSERFRLKRERDILKVTQLFAHVKVASEQFRKGLPSFLFSLRLKKDPNETLMRQKESAEDQSRASV